MKKQDQILTLIENEIISSKLIKTLNNIEIDTSHYDNDLSEIIFDLVGIKKQNRTENLYRKYFLLVKKGEELDWVRHKDASKKLALKIYLFLLDCR